MGLNKRQERLVSSVEGAVFRWIKLRQTRLTELLGGKIPVSYDPKTLLEILGAKFDRHPYADGVTLVAAFSTTYDRDAPAGVWAQVALSRHNGAVGVRKPHEPNGPLDKLELSVAHDPKGKPPYIDMCFDLREEGLNARTVRRDLKAAGNLVSKILGYWISDHDAKSYSKSGKELAAALQGARGRLSQVEITPKDGTTHCLYRISPNSRLEVVVTEDPSTDNDLFRLIAQGQGLPYDLAKYMYVGNEREFLRVKRIME